MADVQEMAEVQVIVKTSLDDCFCIEFGNVLV